MRRDDWVDLGECKWGEVPSVPHLMSALESKVECYPNPENATVGRLFFTRRRVKPGKAGESARLFCLQDLYQSG